ncbi:GFA family protein [Agrobacterium tumefaciens]|uniref:GFA family protein n=1 Tax=Agrobacterium TaxID=357 RepID=UPI00115F2C6E|nr:MULTISPECIES: GFA family protein [Agrobacterium]MDA5242180.1 GFA family protein [Agrobacterium sp. MAFF310724]MDA5248440.1 GFA family protein [Agrobacterium sp. MAFF210268]NTE82049.1 GFA family protein [Agrobacterium tumefaciens]TRB15459.1 GFA family protein [Agrobacterium tumefaciens]WCA58023.1 GFA family protein [Agrobacterium tumefaciens]
MTTIRNGGCLCGSIRFEAKGEPGNPHTCSCDICQRHSGAPSLAWVEFGKDAVTWTGEGGAPSTFRSSDYSSRAFCPTCGSTLGAVDDAPTVALVFGSFDDRDDEALRPLSHSFEDVCPVWARIEGMSPAE